jgi:predicted SnoaL-like aldol condensation-catalyzing enzyme
MFNQCEPRAAIERYAGAEYRQHNPEVADGPDAFVEHWDVLRVVPDESANDNGMF